MTLLLPLNPAKIENSPSSDPSSKETPKPKAYQASGFQTSDPQQIVGTLEQILASVSVAAEIQIRTVAPSAGEADEYTAVFVFVDNIPRPQCEGSYPLPAILEINTSIAVRDGSFLKPTYISINSHFKGLTILHDPTTERTIDLVVLPGLGGGHAYRSFKDPGGQYMWLIDSLRYHLPIFRIVTYGFDTAVPDSDNAQDLEAMATEFRASLRSIRAQSTTPIVFLAHSLGGLVIKQAMVNMARSSDLVDQANFFATYGMYFFGVPNDGMNINALKPMVHDQPNEEFIMSLAKNSQLLRNLGREFSNTFSFPDSQIVSFYETRYSPGSRRDPKTDKWSMTGDKLLLVDQTSATHGRPTEYEAHHIQALDLDHPSLVRYSPGDHNYSIVRSYLEPCAQVAHGVVRRRLEQRRQDALKIQRIALQMDSDRGIVASNLPPLSPNFIAREAELLAIENYFRTTDENRPTVVLHGLGGVGKTEVALAYAHSRIDHYPCIFWVDSDTQQTVTQSFRIICQDIITSAIQAEATNSEKTGDIEPYIDQRKEQQLVKSVKRWLAHSSHRDWLLILDNVDDLQSYSITQYLPAVNGHTIITSRRPEGDFPFIAIAINELRREDAVRLLLQITRRIQRNQTVEDAPDENETKDSNKLARLLGDLPLAIELAGAVINRRQIPYARYIEIFNETPRPAILGDNPVRWPPRNEDTIFTTWQISLTHVHKAQPDSERLLRFCGFLDPTNISQEFLRRGLDQLQSEELETGSGLLEQMRRIVLNRDYYEDVVGVLYSYSLAKSRASSKNLRDKSHAFSMHKLVHVWSRSTLDDNSANDHSAAALILVDSALKLDNTTASWVLKREAVPHIEICYRNLPLLRAISSIVLEALDRLAETLRDQSRLLAAKDVFKKLIAQREQQAEFTNTTRIALVENMHKLGLVYRELSEFDEAKRVTLRAIEGRKALFLLEDPRHLSSTNLLASILCEQGDCETAEKVMTDILIQQTATIGRDCEDTQKTIQGLAIVMWYQNKNVEAIKLNEEAVAWTEKHKEPKHPHTLLAKENLAIAYNRNKEHAKALVIYNDLVSSSTDVMGTTHIQTMSNLVNRCLAFKDVGQYENAMKDVDQVLEMERQTYEEDGGDFQTSALFQRAQHSKALILEGAGEFEKAIRVYKEALTGMERVYGRENQMTANVGKDLAITYRKMGRADEADKVEAAYEVNGERD